MRPPLTSWLPLPPGTPFPVTNLPYGVFSRNKAGPEAGVPTPGVAVGDSILDLAALAGAGLLPETAAACFVQEGGRPTPTLNPFMAAGAAAWADVRAALLALVAGDPPADARLANDAALRSRAVVPASDVTMHLPAAIGDYTDFYASREHATNCGCLFRDPATALPPNWLHLPVAYHGRASTVGVSPAAITRPLGQLPPAAGSSDPSFGPCARLDFELEVGVFIGGPANAPGTRTPLSSAPDRIFGYVLLNDWSARDIQRWEMVPLGPFAGKNFGTTISPWVVTPAALAPWAVPAPAQADPSPPAYLSEADAGIERTTYDLPLTVSLAPGGGEPHIITRSNLRHLYWTPAQMVAHHTAGGCVLRAGDLLGTGTISAPGGPEGGGLGSLLEASLDGTVGVGVGGGEERTFLEDGDAVILGAGTAGEGAGGYPTIGFGECRGVVVPAPGGVRP